MTAGSISPRWVPVAVYCTVLAAGLYSSAIGLGGAVQGSQVAGFVVVIAVLLAVEAAEWRWLPLPPPRWEMLALLATRLGLFVAAAALDPSGEFWVLFILVPFAAYFALGRTVSLVLGGVCLTFVLAGFTLRVPHWYTQPTYLSDVLMFSVGLVLAIAMAGTAIGEQAGRIRLEAALRDLRESHGRLTAYAGQVADLSAEAERNRLARDIHDSLGHHLTAIAVQLEKAQAFRGRDGSAADQAVADARWLARQALQDVRGSVAALRGDEPSAPLSVMLADLARQAGPGEPLVTLTITGDEACVGAATRMVLFRTAQEALTNARRHSGAGQVRVSVTVDDGETRLVVTDNGRGFDPSQCSTQAGRAAQEGLGGFGLLSIRERAALAGGHAEIASRPGAGTTVTVAVPASVTASGMPA
ncbi:MAG TPA: sensor histidine kinase [Streptosporangiaceae bacterium]|nr:sensor histidine kinase [Streptosporangiaceae bacterium]